MKLLLAGLVVVGTVGVAQAQAPGEVAPVAPPPAPAQPSVAASAEVNPMANRVGVGVGITALTAKDEGNEASFQVASIAVRYRATRVIELELELFGGRETMDGGEGPHAIGGGFFGLRYRIAPHKRWNGYAGLGVGQVMIEQHETTDEMLEGSKRSLVRFSGGLEHRWQRFSLGGELALSMMGEREDGGYYVFDYYSIAAAQQLTGLELSLRGAFYF